MKVDRHAKAQAIDWCIEILKEMITTTADISSCDEKNEYFFPELFEPIFDFFMNWFYIPKRKTVPKHTKIRPLEY